MTDRDILLTDNNELSFANGDLATGSGSAQHVSHILQATPGDYKLSPLSGVALHKMLKAAMGPREIKQYENEIRDQLKRDGFKIEEVSISDNGIIVKANR